MCLDKNLLHDILDAGSLAMRQMLYRRTKGLSRVFGHLTTSCGVFCSHLKDPLEKHVQQQFHNYFFTTYTDMIAPSKQWRLHIAFADMLMGVMFTAPPALGHFLWTGSSATLFNGLSGLLSDGDENGVGHMVDTWVDYVTNLRLDECLNLGMNSILLEAEKVLSKYIESVRNLMRTNLSKEWDTVLPTTSITLSSIANVDRAIKSINTFMHNQLNTRKIAL
jgi:hypothetical protein